jgi:putative transposase
VSLSAGAAPQVADVCRQLGVSEASFYLWRKKYARLGRWRSASCGSCAMRTRLKRLVADLTLDKHILGEVGRKSSEVSAPAQWIRERLLGEYARRFASPSSRTVAGTRRSRRAISRRCAYGFGRSRMPERA